MKAVALTLAIMALLPASTIASPLPEPEVNAPSINVWDLLTSGPKQTKDCKVNTQIIDSKDAGVFKRYTIQFSDTRYKSDITQFYCDKLPTGLELSLCVCLHVQPTCEYKGGKNVVEISEAYGPAGRNCMGCVAKKLLTNMMYSSGCGTG